LIDPVHFAERHHDLKLCSKVGLLSDKVIADYTRYSCDIYSAISPAYHAFNTHPDGKALYSGCESSVHRVLTVITNSGAVNPNVWP